LGIEKKQVTATNGEGMKVDGKNPMSMSRVDAAKREWEDLAHLDPLWAILTEKKKQFGKWDREEFFATGQAEIDALMRSCGFSSGNNGRALDFGCGVGRLSRALHSYFGEVHGVDISGEMVRLAKQYTPSCNFHVNPADDLKLFQDDFFDFIYSNIVLQHQSSKEIAKAYITEFIRVIKPKGLIVFQMPGRVTLRGTIQARRRLYSLLRMCGVPADFIYKKLHLNPMRALCVPPEEIVATVSAGGGRVLRSYPDNFNYHSMSYVVVKREAGDGGHEVDQEK
jgi:2-polyprenyl-3-methyl-5-hydroxy-6-metoxy-1,4-benzoquinol methylase